MSTLTTLDDWLELAKGGRSATDWIDCFAPGQHHEGKQVWTDADVASVLANWRLNRRSRYVPPLGVLPNSLGHDEQLLWMADDSMPSVGEVVDLRKGPGGVMQIRLSAPPKVALAVARGLFGTCSAELYPNPPPGCRGSGPMLKRVALLGFQAPANKGLDGLTAGRYAERPPRPRTWVERAGGRTYLFSEGPAMAADGANLESVVDDLITSQPVQLTPEIVADLPPDLKAKIAAILTPGGDTGGGDGSNQMADPPADRAQLISEILAAGGGQYTQEQLDAMTDDQLKALWRQVVGGDTSNMADPNKPATPPGRNLPAVPDHQFAEMRRTAAVILAQQRQIRAEQEAARRQLAAQQRAAHAGAVHSFCEQLTTLGFVTPAMVGTPQQPGPVRAHLAGQSSVPPAHKFGEQPAKSPLETAVEAVKAQGTNPKTGRPMFVGLFAEKIAAGGAGADDDLADVTTAAKAYAAKLNKRKGA